MKKILCSTLLASLLFTHSYAVAGSEELLLADIVSNGTQQIKALNDQIKIATDALDQIGVVNKTLDSVDKLLTCL